MDQGANCIHGVSARAGLYNGERCAEAAWPLLEVDRVLEFGKLLVSQLPKIIHLTSCQQSVSSARVEIIKLSGNHADGLVVWSEVILVSGEQISPLAGLCILIAGQDFVQRIDRLMDAKDLAVVAADELSGEKNDRDGDNQQCRHRQKKASDDRSPPRRR